MDIYTPIWPPAQFVLIPFTLPSFHLSLYTPFTHPFITFSNVLLINLPLTPNPYFLVIHRFLFPVRCPHPFPLSLQRFSSSHSFLSNSHSHSSPVVIFLFLQSSFLVFCTHPFSSETYKTVVFSFKSAKSCFRAVPAPLSADWLDRVRQWFSLT